MVTTWVVTRSDTMSTASSEPRYPSAEEEGSWTAAWAALDEFLAAFRRRDIDGIAAAENRLLAIPIDWDAYLNTIRVPRDAGDWAPDLEAILRRIPDGWGRWIRVGPGWYPIIVAVDRKLADLDPDYRVLQVKEKFGGLRYYWRPRDAEQGEGPAALGNELVNAAAALAASTCEDCGRPGTLVDRQGWLSTLCDACATRLGYSALETEDAPQ
ncbi:MAG: hypothetical protein ACRDWD_06385 [Acidimicrobiia bacterium]